MSFFRIILPIWWSSVVPYKCCDCFSISVKNIIGIFIRLNCIKSINCFVYYEYFNNINSSKLWRRYNVSFVCVSFDTVHQSLTVFSVHKAFISLIKFITFCLFVCVCLFVCLMLLWMGLFFLFLFQIVCCHCIGMQLISVCWFFYPSTLLKLHIVLTIWYSLYKIISTTNRDDFTSSFSIGMPFIFFFPNYSD